MALVLAFEPDPRQAAALKHVVNTFFDGSIEKVVAALLGPDGSRLSDEELERIAGIVAKAKAEEKR